MAAVVWNAVVIICCVSTFVQQCIAQHNQGRIISAQIEDLVREKTGSRFGVESSVIAFSAARTKSLKGHKQRQYALEFDHIFFNQGQYFDPKTGVFTAPQGGVYEFSYSGGAVPHKKLSLQLMKNHYEVQSLAYDGHQKKKPDIQSQRMLLELESGDRIWIRLAKSRQYGVVGATKHGYVTTFTGHKVRAGGISTELDGVSLTPVQLKDRHGDVTNTRRSKRSRSKRLARGSSGRGGSEVVAFSVAKTISVFGSGDNKTFERSSRDGAMTYDRVFVNTDDVINIYTGEFEAPINGLYYFAYTVGKYPKMKLSVALMKNENEFQILVYDESTSSKRHMQSQSIILQLQAEDKIWLKSFNAENYAVYSNLGNYITFNGYLLNALR